MPQELILNWDQAGIEIVPINTWTMELCGTKFDELRQVAEYCGCVVWKIGWELQLSLYRGKTTCCHPHRLCIPSGLGNLSLPQ